MKNGKIKITLDALLKEKGISKTKFAQHAELQMTQLNRYINNDIALVSIDVLGRMCSVLECNVCDILTFEETED